MISLRKTIVAAALLACAATSGASASTWPVSVVGVWTGDANGYPLSVNVSSQATAVGYCKSIAGTITDVNSGSLSAMTGYYCPQSGAVAFMRKGSRNATFQVFSGSLDQVPPTGQLFTLSLLMGGSFNEYSSVGSLGKYEFSLNH